MFVPDSSRKFKQQDESFRNQWLFNIQKQGLNSKIKRLIVLKGKKSARSVMSHISFSICENDTAKHKQVQGLGVLFSFFKQEHNWCLGNVLKMLHTGLIFLGEC